MLITGGAGFIGSRLHRRLIAAGAEVTAFDRLIEQVHGLTPAVDRDLSLIVGDVRDRSALEEAVAVSQPQIVYHLAAETGTGQSADEPFRYCDVNVGGTAILIEVLKAAARPPERVVLAATRAVYGEGAYCDAGGAVVAPAPRSSAAMMQGRFDPVGEDGRELTPLATREDLPPRPSSIYGSTKLMQEYLLQQTPAPWDAAILRLQNVYGPGQSLRNPYTGVLSIFCQQAIAGQRLGIYEDGRIFRDFVFVDDVVTAFVKAGIESRAGGAVLNIGSGRKTSIREAAELILRALGRPTETDITGAFRAGDIRHAVADIAQAQSVLGWRPEVSIEQGVERLAAWAREQPR